MTVTSPPAPRTNPGTQVKGRASRFRGWLREQCRFSLATLLEFAIALSATIGVAATRANRSVAMACIAVVLGIVVLRLRRREGRRVLQSTVFLLLIAASYVGGVYITRHVRMEAAQALIDSRRAEWSMKGQELAFQTATLASTLTTTRPEVEARFVENFAAKIPDDASEEARTAIMNALHAWFNTRDPGYLNLLFPSHIPLSRDDAQAELQNLCSEMDAMQKQLRESTAAQAVYEVEDIRFSQTISQLTWAAADTGVFIAPLPATFEGWSPLLVPIEKRCELKVSSEMVVESPEELKAVIFMHTGMRCEIEPQLGEALSFTLRVRDMKARLWFDWIARVTGSKCRVDPGGGTVYFTPDK